MYFFVFLCISLSSTQILSESYLLDQKAAEYNNQNNQNLQLLYDDSRSDTTKSSIQSDRTEETDLSSNLSIPSTISPVSTAIKSKIKKESGLFNKCKFIEYILSFSYKFLWLYG